MGRIPDRWLEYSASGEPIENVPIVAFKTPLSEKYHRPAGCEDKGSVFVEKEQEFTPAQLCEKFNKNGYEFAVIIDLTNTFRYYDGFVEFWNNRGIQYDKVKCEGQKVPNDGVMHRVAAIMNDVIYQHGRKSKKLVGIHCTHGVNRTGYIVSRYLIEWLGYTPEKALEAVNLARGYKMEREAYINDLKERTPKMGFDEFKQQHKKQSFIPWDFDQTSENYSDFDRCETSDVLLRTDTERTVKDRYHPYESYAPRRNRRRPLRHSNRPSYSNQHRWNNRHNNFTEDVYYRDDLSTTEDFISEPFRNDQFFF